MSHLPDEWVGCLIGDFSKVTYGYTAKTSFEEVGPRFLRITDISADQTVNWNRVPCCEINNKDRKKHTLKDGDIVFARTGATTGKSHLVKNSPESVCASYLIRLSIISNSILPQYLIRYFQTKSYWDVIKEGVSGSAQGGFNAKKLSNLLVPISPLQELKQSILQKAFTGELTNMPDQELKEAC